MDQIEPLLFFEKGEFSIKNTKKIDISLNKISKLFQKQKCLDWTPRWITSE